MKYALVGFGFATALLAVIGWFFTRSTVTEELRVRFDQGLIISHRITSEGGSLGNERYEVFAERDGRQDKVFEGVNGHDFRITKDDPGLMRIRFCDGTIEHLSEIEETDRHRRVAVEPDIYCPGLDQGNGL